MANIYRTGLIVFVLLLALYHNVAVLFKLTNAYCESLNESAVDITHCRLRAKSRNISLLTIEVFFKHKTSKIDLNIALKKKANGYKPFLYNVKIDACQFMRRNNNPLTKILHSFIKDFSTLNHTCPYEGKQMLKDFYPKLEHLAGIILPTGDYLIEGTWTFHNKPTFVTNLYFAFVED